MVDLRLLRYFVATVDAGTITQAAADLYVAQPSLSRQIRRLEQSLGFALFDRTKSRISLTAAGQAFLPVAQDLISRAAQAEGVARGLATGLTPKLTVATASTTSTDIIAPFIVNQGQPVAIGNVIESSPETVYSIVRRGRADLAIGTRLPPSQLRHAVIGTVYLWAQCIPSHPVAEHRSIDLIELANHQLFVMPEESAVRRTFDNAIATKGLSYHVEAETHSSRVAQALAATGSGVCITSDDARYGLSEVRIHSNGHPLEVNLYAAWDPTHYAADRVENLANEIGGFIELRYPRD